MMEGIKKVDWKKNGILWLFSVSDPPKIQYGHHIGKKQGDREGNASAQLLRMIAIKLMQF